MEHGTNKRFEYNRVSWHFLIFKLGLFLAQDAPLPLLTDTLTTPCCEREAVLPAAVRSSWKAAAVGTQCTSSHLALDVVPRMDTARAGPRAGRVQGLGWHDLPTADLTRQRFSCWANSLVSLRPLGKKKKNTFFPTFSYYFTILMVWPLQMTKSSSPGAWHILPPRAKSSLFGASLVSALDTMHLHSRQHTKLQGQNSLQNVKEGI